MRAESLVLLYAFVSGCTGPTQPDGGKDTDVGNPDPTEDTDTTVADSDTTAVDTDTVDGDTDGDTDTTAADTDTTGGDTDTSGGDSAADSGSADWDHDGYSALFGVDCNDNDASVYPGAPELCDGHYNDCNSAGSWQADEEAGLVTRRVGSVWTDVTATFTGNLVLADGEYNICAGTYPVNLRLPAGGNAYLLGRPTPTGTFPVLTGSSTGQVLDVGDHADRVHSTIELVNLVVENGKATDGGCLAAYKSTVSLSTVTFQECAATWRGGGAYLEESTLNWSVVSFHGNDAADGGGAYLNAAPTDPFWENVLDHVDFYANEAVVGAGLSALDSNLVYYTGVIEGNYANSPDAWTDALGGGVLLWNSTADLSFVEFSANYAYNGFDEAHAGGAGLYARMSTSPASSLVMTDFLAHGNGTSGEGGGMMLVATQGGVVELTRGTMRANSAGGNGGGIALVLHEDGAVSDGTSVMDTVTILDGGAMAGGALSVRGGDLTVKGSTFSGNSATDAGGGVWAKSTAMDVMSTTVADNRTTSDAGGVGAFGAGLALIADSDEDLTIRLNDVSVTGNEHDVGLGSLGGGVAVRGGILVEASNGTVIRENWAVYGSGVSLDTPAAAIGRLVSGPGMLLRDSEISSNASQAVYISSGNLRCSYGRIISNGAWAVDVGNAGSFAAAGNCDMGEEGTPEDNVGPLSAPGWDIHAGGTTYSVGQMASGKGCLGSAYSGASALWPAVALGTCSL